MLSLILFFFYFTFYIIYCTLKYHSTLLVMACMILNGNVESAFNEKSEHVPLYNLTELE